MLDTFLLPLRSFQNPPGSAETRTRRCDALDVSTEKDVSARSRDSGKRTTRHHNNCHAGRRVQSAAVTHGGLLMMIHHHERGMLSSPAPREARSCRVKRDVWGESVHTGRCWSRLSTPTGGRGSVT